MRAVSGRPTVKGRPATRRDPATRARRPAAPGEGDGRAEAADGSAGHVYRGVVEGLYLGRYVPGQRLVETDLVRDFAVGRGTVREALNRLAADGVVSLTLHRGALVRSLGRDEIRDVLALLELLIGFVARIAAERIAEGESRKALAASLARLKDPRTRRDAIGFVRARDGFYRTLIEIGGNRELARVLRSMHVHLVRAQLRILGASLEEAWIEDYARIAAAVRAGDPRKAEDAARAHIKRAGRAVEALPDEAFPQRAGSVARSRRSTA